MSGRERKRSRNDGERLTIRDVVATYRPRNWARSLIVRRLREEVAIALEKNESALSVTLTLPAEIPAALVISTLKRVSGVAGSLHSSTGVSENTFEVELDVCGGEEAERS